MTPDLSKDIHVMYNHAFPKLANNHIRHQATHKDKDKDKDLFIGDQEFVVGYSKAPEQARTSHHTHCCIRARHATHCATGDDIKWAVSLVIAYGHFNVPQRFLWLCMG